MSNLQVYSNSEAVAVAAAQTFVTRVRSAVARRGVCRVVLAGGSTPKLMHQMLVSESFKDKIPWERLAVFWGDERCVPADHADSNYKMAAETLFNVAPIPESQIYRMPGELEPLAGAKAYQQTLQTVFGADVPLPIFDIILLGIGPDGHTASLFPKHPLLDETESWVAPIFDSPKPPPERLTLTLPVINAARHIFCLVTGASKTAAFKAAQSGDLLKTEEFPEGYKPPIALVNPNDGELTWFADQAAAG